MPRFARPHVAGGLFHVISRFRDGEYLLDAPGARRKYLEFLGQAISKSDARLLAYCLMSNHVHLVVQLGIHPLGKLTRAIHAGWVNWLNPVVGRRGAAMADRPDSLLCDSEMYGRALVRYVHNNPVRAGLVGFAAESNWSSHRAYLGDADAPEWLDVGPVLRMFGDDQEQARERFGHFVDEGRFEPRREDLSGKVTPDLARRIRKLIGGPVEISYPVLGSDGFLLEALGEQIERNDASKLIAQSELTAGDVLYAVCDATGFDPGLVLGASRERRVARVRKAVAWIWCEKLGRKQVDLAALFGVRPAAVTKMLSTWRTKVMLEEDCRSVEKAYRLLLERASTQAIRTAGDSGGGTADSAGSASTVRVRILQRARDTAPRTRSPFRHTERQVKKVKK